MACKRCTTVEDKQDNPYCILMNNEENTIFVYVVASLKFLNPIFQKMVEALCP